MGSDGRQPTFPARLTAGLVLFSIVLMASVLVISIVTLVQVSQMEREGPAPKVPDPRPQHNNLNIPPPTQISAEADSGKFKVYGSYVERLNDSLDLSRDPCNNFYEYSCGNYKGSSSFVEVVLANLFTLIEQFQKSSYFEQPTLPKPVKQAKVLMAKCMEAKSDWAKEVGKGERLKAKMDRLDSLLNVPFPALNPDQEVPSLPSAQTFSAILAHLEKEEGVPTFVSSSIDTNWADPHGPRPYLLVFDQATLALPEAYYIRVWDDIKDSVLKNIVGILKAYAEFKGLEPNAEKIEEDAKAMVQMEFDIATKLNTREAERRNYKRMYNVYKVETANLISPHLKFEQLVAGNVPAGMDLGRVGEFVVTEARAMKETLDYLFSSGKVQPRTMYNYFYTRLLDANLKYLPRKPKLAKLPQITHFQLGLPRGPRPRPSPYIADFPLDLSTMSNPTELECALENANLLPWANGRVYLDAKFPKKEERPKLRASIRTMVAGVVDAFKGMLAQLNWMSLETKNAANDKINKLITNAAWPEIVEDDERLTKFYEGVDFKEEMSYTQMVDALLQDQKAHLFKQLFTAKNIDREDFLMSPSIVNAWYNPNLNSITFPLGILEPPFYDPEYPASVNYGGMGLVAGHELTHGFDDQGIQWDGTGVLRPWIDAKSEGGFKNMAQCVVDEYSQFEPIKGLPIDGTMTQGENIADNGGLRAAYRAYRTHVGLYGPDKRLPDPKLRMFSHDQLFFLSFAQVWCKKDDPGALKQQLLIDPHSPSKYRILGTVQNFPAFRAAFNCPLGTVYGPAEHCQVWETESKAN